MKDDDKNFGADAAAVAFAGSSAPDAASHVDPHVNCRSRRTLTPAMQPDDVIDQRIQGLMRETRAQVTHPPADPVEYAICERRGHDLHFYAMIGDERICRWCGVRVRELNPPETTP
jgi:hypothetical protein